MQQRFFLVLCYNYYYCAIKWNITNLYKQRKKYIKQKYIYYTATNGIILDMYATD